MAVYFRAFLAILRRLADKVFLKLLDAVFILSGIYFIQSYWATSVVFKDGGNYPIEFLLIAVPAYIFIWLFLSIFPVVTISQSVFIKYSEGCLPAQ